MLFRTRPLYEHVDGYANFAYPVDSIIGELPLPEEQIELDFAAQAQELKVCARPVVSTVPTRTPLPQERRVPSIFFSSSEFHARHCV
jgi:hypothetical protein